MKENCYRRARKLAAAKNPLLNNCETAQDIVRIERTRLIAIENGQKTPYPDEVARMAEVYHAPELCNQYCTGQCSIGCKSETLLYDDLNQISAHLMAALHFLEGANDSIYEVLEDGKITEDEQSEFAHILQTLDKITYGAQSLKLWAQKNGLT